MKAADIAFKTAEPCHLEDCKDHSFPCNQCWANILEGFDYPTMGVSYETALYDYLFHRYTHFRLQTKVFRPDYTFAFGIETENTIPRGYIVGKGYYFRHEIVAIPTFMEE